MLRGAQTGDQAGALTAGPQTATATASAIACPVCSEVSEQPYLNYGAKACYSCRAFFRRAHQKTRYPQFVCKVAPRGAEAETEAGTEAGTGRRSSRSPQRCVINVRTRRQCQKCRYDACLAAGMRPEYVMDETAKRARFKKAIQYTCDADPVEGSIVEGSCRWRWVTRDNDQRSAVARKIKVANAFRRVVQMEEEEEESVLASMDALFDLDLRSQSRHASHSQYHYQSHSHEQLQSSGVSPQDDLCSFFEDSSDVLSSLGQYLDSLGTRADPADPIGEVASGGGSDRGASDRPMHVPMHIHMQRGFSCDSGFGGSCSISPPANGIGMTATPKDDNEEEDEMQDHTGKPKVATELPYSFESSDEDETEDESTAIVPVSRSMEIQVGQDLAASAFPTIPVFLEVPFTDEEQMFMYHQFRRLRESYYEVPLGRDFLHEFIMYSLDVPLSKHFVPVIMQTSAERFKQTLNKCQTFRAMPSSLQSQMINSNVDRCVALIVARICNAKNGRGQLEVIVGNDDGETMNRHFSPYVNISGLKKLKMREINKQTRLLTTRELERYCGLVEKLSTLVSNTEIFNLVTLVMLFDVGSEASSSDGAIGRCHRSFLTILQRRLRDLCRDTYDYEWANVMQAFADVTQLAKIIANMKLE